MDRTKQTDHGILSDWLTSIYPMAIIIVMTASELKAWRIRNGYTQVQLAKTLGVGQVCVARWETDVRKIPSFLHLALDALEYKAKEVKKDRGYGNENEKGGVRYG